jgi:hypothetical protein
MHKLNASIRLLTVRWIWLTLLITLSVLMTPALTLRFEDEVNWGAEDSWLRGRCWWRQAGLSATSAITSNVPGNPQSSCWSQFALPLSGPMARLAYCSEGHISPPWPQ